jgi:hypothetical protein
MAAPMLREPPVTSATLPASFFVMLVRISFFQFISCSLDLSFIYGKFDPDALNHPIPSSLSSDAFSA